MVARIGVTATGGWYTAVTQAQKRVCVGLAARGCGQKGTRQLCPKEHLLQRGQCLPSSAPASVEKRPPVGASKGRGNSGGKTNLSHNTGGHWERLEEANLRDSGETELGKQVWRAAGAGARPRSGTNSMANRRLLHLSQQRQPRGQPARQQVKPGTWWAREEGRPRVRWLHRALSTPYLAMRPREQPRVQLGPGPATCRGRSASWAAAKPIAQGDPPPSFGRNRYRQRLLCCTPRSDPKQEGEATPSEGTTTEGSACRQHVPTRVRRQPRQPTTRREPPPPWQQPGNHLFTHSCDATKETLLQAPPEPSAGRGGPGEVPGRQRRDTESVTSHVCWCERDLRAATSSLPPLRAKA
nr:uncharacterized protein LOC105880842 [Microcebus murinus]